MEGSVARFRFRAENPISGKCRPGPLGGSGGSSWVQHGNPPLKCSGVSGAWHFSMAHKKSRTAGNGGFPNFCADARKRPKGEHRALFLGKCETVEVTPRIFQMHAYCFPNFCADARKRPKAEHQALFLGKCETVEKSRTAGSGK